MKLPNSLANKLHSSLFFVPAALIITAVYAWAYPSVPRSIEFDTLFLHTPDYLSDKLSAPAGFSSLVTCYLQQFYRSSAVAAALLFLSMLLIAYLCHLTLRRAGIASRSIALLPAIAVSTTYVVGAEAAVQSVFFWLFLAIYTLIPRFRPVYAALLCLPAYAVLPWTAVLCCLLVSAFVEAVLFKQPKNLIGQGIGLVLLAVLPTLWNAWVGFIPFDERYWGDTSWLTLIVCLLPLPLAWLVHRVHLSRVVWEIALTVILTGGAIYYTLTRQEYIATEITARLTYLAEEERWQELLAEVSYEDCVQPLYLRYALLAENALGTLSQHLMYYPVSSSNDFLFQHDNMKVGLNFNRLFYQNINVPDECFRLSFEYGTRCTDCFSLGALRCMTDYAIQSGDTAVASKYLRILEQNVLHGDWVKAEREKMSQVRVDPFRLRSNTFVGAMPIVGEMARLVDEDRSDMRRMEYLLCGLLLEKNLNSFGAVLKASKLYRNGELPRAYAEAVAVLATQDPSLRTLFKWSPDIDSRLLQFMQNRSKGPLAPEVMSFSNTYWYYLFFKQAPEAETQKNS